MTDFIINSDALETAIKTLLPFVSKEETRYYLCGINFNRKAASEFVYAASTDGHKLCQLEIDANIADGDNDEINAILPYDACKTILSMLKSVGNKDFPIQMEFKQSSVHVNCGDQKADFKLIDGSFPDYRKVIPTEAPSFKIGLAKAQAKEAVKAIQSHKDKEPMEWRFIDATSPLTLVSEKKIVVVMPMRVSFDEELNIGK
jgi:DNA polymerase-3 subunit beta